MVTSVRGETGLAHRCGTDEQETQPPAVAKEAHEDAEMILEDVKADEAVKSLVTLHTVALEGSIGLVNVF